VDHLLGLHTPLPKQQREIARADIAALVEIGGVHETVAVEVGTRARAHEPGTTIDLNVPDWPSNR